MKKIGFVGAFDKTDLIVQVAKILTVLGNRVLVLDTTITQKVKYIIPVINPTVSYVTEFEEIDIGVGFDDFEEVKEYLGLTEKESLNYDIVLIDIDSTKAFDNFDMRSAETNFFVTSFDLYSLKKGLEIISGYKEEIPMTKILYSKEMLQEEDDYLNFLSMRMNVNWNPNKIYFPFEQGDQSVIIENQRVAKIKFRNLSEHYKESLLMVVNEIIKEIKFGELRKVLRSIEKNS